MRPRLTARVLRGIDRIHLLAIGNLVVRGEILARPPRDQREIERAWKWANDMIVWRADRAKIRKAGLNPKTTTVLRRFGNGRKI
jgi:hypothetical protein